MARTSIRDQSDKGNRYAIRALKDRRATLAGEIQRFKDGIKRREQQLDATLRILDPEYRADTIAPKRIRRGKLFGGGELNRLIIDALRRANGEGLSRPQIADAIIAAKRLRARGQTGPYPAGAGEPVVSAVEAEGSRESWGAADSAVAAESRYIAVASPNIKLSLCRYICEFFCDPLWISEGTACPR